MNIEMQMESFMQRCREAGLKATHQRMEIYRELASTTEHPDAETVYKRVRQRMPSMSFDTVYRTLRSLSECGLITRMSTMTDRTRYDADMHPHHHFFCEQCGTIIDFDAPAVNAAGLAAQIPVPGQVRSLHVEVRGICQACMEEKEKKNNK